MALVGVDLNSRKIAACILDSEWTRRVVHFRHESKAKDRAAILHELHAKTLQLVFPGDVVYVESPVLAGVRNIQSTIKVAAAYGTVLSACHEAHARVVEVPVSLWKMHTVGRGNASKLDVSAWLNDTHPDHHRECTGDQDLIDATCIALFAQLTERDERGERSFFHPTADEEHPRHRGRRD